MNIKSIVKRFFGSSETAYEPGTGRIVQAHDLTSAAGVRVTVETALTIPAFLHGVRTIAQTVGMLDFDVMHHLIAKNAEGIEQRRQEVATSHPVHHLLHSEPNEFQSTSDWRETMIAHAVATGNGFSYIERNGNFRPTALLPLLPDRTGVQVLNGQLSYATNVNGEMIELDPWNVFHIKGFSWDGVRGMPLVKLMQRALGLDIAQMKFAEAFYGNGTNMGGVVEYAGTLTDKARQNLKSSMKREYAGVGNAFRTLFLEEGMKYTKLGTAPQDAQYIEGRKFSLGDMARIIGVPPHLLYDLSQSTNNNIEHQGIEAVTYAFNPWANKFTHEANRKLLYESEKFEYFTRIDTKPLMAGDSAAQAAQDKQRFDCLVLTPNEIRAKDGRNPIEGGDSLYLNTALMPLAAAVAKIVATIQQTQAQTAKLTVTPGIDTEPDEGDDTPTPDPDAGIKPPDGLPGPEVPKKLIQDDRAILSPMIRDAVDRIIRRETKIIDNQLTKLADNPQAFRDWFAGFEQEQAEHITRALDPVSESLTAAGRQNVKWSDFVTSHIANVRSGVEQIISADPQDQDDAKWAVLDSWKQRPGQAVNELLGTL